jgi:uncharacterized membrane protein YfcA
MPEITLLHTLLVSALVFLGGFVDSIAGGGGLVTLPAYLAIGLPPHLALATNKFSSSCGTLIAVTRYHAARTIDFKVGLVSAAGALVGSAVGARIALMVPARVINLTMLAVIPAVAVFFFLKDRILSKQVVGNPAAGVAVKSALIGLAIGCYDGFFGPGTGTFLTVAFSTFLAFDLLQASANARFANFASNIGSLAVFLVGGKVLFPLALYTAAAGVAGNYLGSHIAIARGAKVIKPLMAAVMALLLVEALRRF